MHWLVLFVALVVATLPDVQVDETFDTAVEKVGSVYRLKRPIRYRVVKGNTAWTGLIPRYFWSDGFSFPFLSFDSF